MILFMLRDHSWWNWFIVALHLLDIDFARIVKGHQTHSSTWEMKSGVYFGDGSDGTIHSLPQW